ncbi:hypothetical protein [Deferrisoma sp.]
MRRRAARGLAAGFGVLLFVAGCQGSGPGRATVSGKTAFRGMGVEGVRVEAYRATAPGPPVAETRSGYHGSFHLRLPPGRYRLVAEGELPSGSGAVLLRGETRIRAGPDRLDRVVIPLAAAPP